MREKRHPIGTDCYSLRQFERGGDGTCAYRKWPVRKTKHIRIKRLETTAPVLLQHVRSRNFAPNPPKLPQQRLKRGVDQQESR